MHISPIIKADEDKSNRITHSAVPSASAEHRAEELLCQNKKEDLKTAKNENFAGGEQTKESSLVWREEY
jgi:hypothetical protein